MKKKRKKVFGKILIMLFLFSTLALSFFKVNNNNPKKINKDLKAEQSKTYAKLSNTNVKKNNENVSNEKSEEVSLMIGGNINDIDKIDKNLIDSKQTYDEFFSYLKNYIEESILFLNLNTSLCKKNSHKEFSKSLKSLDVDIINSSYKNMLKNGTKNFFETFDILKNNNLRILGLKDNLAEKDYKIINKNNNKLGIISYNLVNKNIENSLDNHIYYLNTENVDEYSFKIEEDMNRLKNEGAEFIVTIVNKNEVSKDDLNKMIEIFKKKGSNLILTYNEENTIISSLNKDDFSIVNNSSGFLSSNNIFDCKDYKMNYIINIVLKKYNGTYKIKSLKYIPLSIYKRNNKLYLIPLKEKKHYKDLNIDNLKDIKILDKRREETLDYLKKIGKNWI